MNTSKVVKISEKNGAKDGKKDGKVPQKQPKGNDDNIHIDKFCLEDPISSHKKHIGFCYTCADNGIANQILTFCRYCNKKLNKYHQFHKQFEDAQDFKKRIRCFKEILYLPKFQEANDQHFLFTIKQDPQKILLELVNEQYRKWLIKTNFWKFIDPRDMDHKLQKLYSFLVDNSDINPNPVPVPGPGEELIDWEKIIGGNGDSIFDEMYKQASNQKEKLMKEKEIVDILIDVYSSFNQKSKNESIEKINRALKIFPNELVLLLAHLYLIQLNGKNQNQWMPILKEITENNPELKDSPFVAYVESHKFWVPMSKQEIKKNKKCIKFVDSSSGNIYKLQNPQKYLETLNKGNGNKKFSSILVAAKGLGLLAEQKYAEATKCFEQASQKGCCESFEMNQLYSMINEGHRNEILVESILQELENKSKHYIINAIKYFKTQNKFENIVECCSVLKEQNNENTFSQIQLMKALMKLGEVEKAQEIKNGIPQQNINDELKQRLNRQLIYAEAKNSIKQNNHASASQKCELLVKGKQSPSALYSLASTYYNRQMWQEAQVNIDRALQLKNCNKYLKLKFYILLMKKQLEQAKKVLQNLPKQDIDPKIKEMLTQLG